MLVGLPKIVPSAGLNETIVSVEVEALPFHHGPDCFVFVECGFRRPDVGVEADGPCRWEFRDEWARVVGVTGYGVSEGIQRYDTCPRSIFSGYRVAAVVGWSG